MCLAQPRRYFGPTALLSPPCGQSFHAPSIVRLAKFEFPDLNSPSHGLSHATSFKNMHSSREEEAVRLDERRSCEMVLLGAHNM